MKKTVKRSQMKMTERDFLIEQCMRDAYCERTGEQLDEGWWDDMKAGAAGMMSKVKDKWGNFKNKRQNAKELQNAKAENAAAYDKWNNDRREAAMMGKDISDTPFQPKHKDLDSWDMNAGVHNDEEMQQRADAAKYGSYAKNTAKFGQYCKETSTALQKAKAMLDKLAKIDAAVGANDGGSIFNGIQANAYATGPSQNIRAKVEALQNDLAAVIEILNKGVKTYQK